MSLFDVLPLLRCPICRASLAGSAQTVRCPAGHAFDVARQGHLNLLNGPQPQHADTPAMVEARLAFHRTDAFADVTAAVVDAVPVASEVVVDAGAGPGSYLAAVLDCEPRRHGLALDVSAAAMRRAARLPRVGAVVADVWQVWPVVDHGADVVLSVFAPRHADELARVLRAGGTLVTVIPGPDHLVQLRRSLGLLEVGTDKQRRLGEQLGARFELTASDRVQRTTAWTSRQAALSVSMGPNAFHVTTAELDRRLTARSWPTEVSVDCRLQTWRRR